MGLAAGLVAEFVDGGVGASAAGFGGAVAGVGSGLTLAAVIDHAFWMMGLPKLTTSSL